MNIDHKPFEPVTVDTLPEGASNFALLRRMFRNPVEIWPRKLYEEFTHEVNFFGKRYVHVTDPDIVQDVLLKNYTLFPRSEIWQSILKRAGGEGLLTIEGERWKFQRKATSPIFRSIHLNKLLPGIIRIADETADLLSLEQGPVDVFEKMDRASLKIIVQTLLSGEGSDLNAEAISKDIDLYLEYNGRIDFFDLFKITRDLPKPWARKGRDAVERLREECTRIIRHRRRSGVESEDLLSMLISASDQDTGTGLSDIEVRDNLITFISAGHETVALTLSWAMYLLARSPEWQEKLLEEVNDICGDAPLQPDHIGKLKKHEMVVKEAMRLFPPVYAQERVALEDVTFPDGTSVRRGDTVVLATYPMHRHEKLWDNPNRFEPERFAPDRAKGHHRFQFIPFSGGPRICIGMGLSMLEAVSILASIVRSNEIKPVEGHTPYPTSRIVLRPAGGVKLYVTPRK
ncbi:cytochrome P450 [Ruegeria arenilitoris]|uniref:cytochrome P450 n=1 Tax=Ruegeria arenilitoris TaxID=1173585 RepID=UPI00147E03DD|nr:cytochrome P450 [Ruegeria arenilitoris]